MSTCNVRLMHQNYLVSDFSGITASSEKLVAQVENVLFGKRRSSVWRSDGFFQITSSNSNILFRESIGVNLLAQINHANYTTDSSFLSAVKTAFQSTGASTYTASRNQSTGKINLSSNGSGGGGLFEIDWTSNSTTAAQTLGFSTSFNDSGSLTYSADAIRLSTSEWIKFDLGSGFNPKAFVAIGRRNDGVGISDTAVLKLQGNHTDSWGAPQFEISLAFSENGFSHFDSNGFYPTGLRYWRLYIEDQSNPLGYLELSKIYLGDTYEPTTGSIQFPFESNFVDLSDTQYSEGGNSFSDIRDQTQTYNLNWNFLTVTEKERLEEFIKLNGTGVPFFISLDPEENFSSQVIRYVLYVKFIDSPNYRLSTPGYFSSDWRLREEI